MNPPILIPAMLLLAATAAIAQGRPDGEDAMSKPMNLSLPRELKRANVMANGSDAAYDPLARDLRERRTTGPGGNWMRYGAGYEARHAESEAFAVGNGSGAMRCAGSGACGVAGGTAGGRGGAGHGR